MRDNTLEDISYFFGAFLGDGSCFKHKKNSWRVTIAGADKEIISRCYLAVKFGLPEVREARLRERANANDTVMYEAVWNGKELAMLIKLAVGDKDYLPLYLWDAPAHIKLAFIAGIMDTDGSVIVQGADYKLKLAGTRSFIKEVPALLSTLAIQVGNIAYERRAINHRPLLRFYINKQSAAEAGLYFRCFRKHARFKEWMNKMKLIPYDPPADWISEYEMRSEYKPSKYR